MGSLREIFEAAASEVANKTGWSPDEGELKELSVEARARCPGVELAPERWVGELAKRAVPPSDIGELYLALACADGDPTALRVFKRDFLSGAEEALAHMRLRAALVDDVVQKTSEKLLLSPEGEPPKVVAYAGQGKLRGLVKVVATRMALSELRKHRREVAFPEHGADIFEAPSESDGELAFIKDRYRAEFKIAFESAIDSLTERERNLLRLHLLRGVTLAKLAEIYGVHRATVTRWLASARSTLLESTRERLGERLDLGRTEIESVMGWIGSRLDASVSRVFRTREGA